MNQKNNKIDVDKLFDIVAHMKSSHDNLMMYEKLLENNPSHGARQMKEEYAEQYERALNDFNYFVENFVKIKNKKEEN